MPGEHEADLLGALRDGEARWRAVAAGLPPASRVLLERTWAQVCAALTVESAGDPGEALLEAWREAARALGASPAACEAGLEELAGLPAACP